MTKLIDEIAEKCIDSLMHVPSYAFTEDRRTAFRMAINEALTEYARRSEREAVPAATPLELVVKAAMVELHCAIIQMAPPDDQIICNRVRNAYKILAASETAGGAEGER